MYVLPCLSVVTMGYSCDPLDVCFGDRLVGSMNLCIGVGACFLPTFSDINFGVILCCMLRDCYMTQSCFHY